MKPIRKLALEKIALPDWRSEADRVRRYERINASQVRYKPRSSVNQTGAAAPGALAPLMEESLERLEEKVGNIDVWVADKLNWTIQEMAGYLTSEQIDAVALAIDSMENQEGFLVADVTGFGKGRIAAAIARYSALIDRKVIFFTEKANLFSDFWRDVRDINSENVFGRPFLLNMGSKIVDTSSSEGTVIFSPLKKAEVDRIIENGVSADTKLIITTYSQFNRQGRKTAFLERMARGSHLMMDEGHNQAGDSATNKNMAPAVKLSASSTYSTATAGRDVANLTAYSSVFPWLSILGDLSEISPSHRRALAEASVREACAAGRIVRREHDLSNMRLNLIEETENTERNRMLTNTLAPILSRMARLSNRVYATIESRNEEAKENKKSEFWFAANFGSRLNNLIGQFLVALKVDMCVEHCVSDICNGYKPVIVIESTMESLMRELSREPEENDNEAEDEVTEDTQEELPIPQTDRPPPTYGEALRIMAQRLLRVSVRRGGPEGEKETIELDDPKMIEIRDEIVEMTKTFPVISLSPIDDIRCRIEEEGLKLYEKGEIPEPWKMDEISARSLRVINGRYVPMENRDRNVSVARFVNGQTHGLVLTNAASTGLSLHDGPNFLQHAPRRMYELRSPRNVIQRIQMWGRVFRRGQLTEPEFFILSTGLDAETFDLAVQNRKVQGLSASVTGDAASGIVVAAQDYEDITGNGIAYDLLMENPGLADSMGISLRVPREEGDKSLYWISKLLRRLWLVGEKDRKFLYSTLEEAYEERIKHGGSDVRDGGMLKGTWRIRERKILHKGDGSGNPVTGNDVYVSDIEQDCIADPIKSKEMAWLVNEAASTFKDRMGNIPMRLKSESSTILESMLTRKWKSVKQALGDKDDNPVKRMTETLKNLSWASEKIKPGVAAVLPGEDGDPTRCMIIDCRFPAAGADIFSPRQWAVSYAVPGEDELRVCNLDIVLGNKNYSFSDRSDGRDMLPSFDDTKGGASVITKKIIDGAPIGAILASMRLHAGTRMSFEDEWNIMHEGMVLPRSAASRVVSLPGIAGTPAAVAAVINAGGRLISSPDDIQSGVEIRPYKDSRLLISFPGARKFSSLTEHPALTAAVGELHSYGQRKEAVASPDALPGIMTALADRGILMQYDPEYRDVVHGLFQETVEISAPRP